MNTPAFRALFSATLIALCPLASASAPVTQVSVSVDCRKAPAGSIDDLVCADAALAELASTMAEAFAAAWLKAVAESPPQLKASQRRWLRSRNDCWKSRARRECVETSYRLRIAELQAWYELLSGNGPLAYVCDDPQASKFVVTFFPTEPPTLIAERGDKRVLMFVQASASGAKYQSRNESFWEHQGEASIVWGRGSKPMRCQPGS